MLIERLFHKRRQIDRFSRSHADLPTREFFFEFAGKHRDMPGQYNAFPANLARPTANTMLQFRLFRYIAEFWSKEDLSKPFAVPMTVTLSTGWSLIPRSMRNWPLNAGS